MSTPLVAEELSVRRFRNLSPFVVRWGPRFNVLFGDNGQGKSNVLEAIRYLSALDSFRGAKVDDLVQVAQTDAELAMTVTDRPLPRRLEIALSRSAQRKLSVDGKRPKSALSWLQVAPTVLFHPGDLVLAQGGPDARRTLLDRVLTEMDATYGTKLLEYQRALRSRNRLLKAEDAPRGSITAYDPMLAERGAAIVAARGALLAELVPHATSAFERIVGAGVPIRIRYRPRVSGDEAALRDALTRSLDKDLARGFTAEGPHADEIELGVKAGSAKQHASQGQQRVLVLALKVAELITLTNRTKRTPMLLLDDVGSELDRERSARFFELLSQIGGQVFLTTTRRDLIQVAGERLDVHVEAGGLQPVRD